MSRVKINLYKDKQIGIKGYQILAIILSCKILKVKVYITGIKNFQLITEKMY